MSANVMPERRRVRVWFGKTPIADYIAAPELAFRYQDAMGKRFAGLPITNEPLPPLPDPETLPPLR
ncbi:hypothetical protein ACIA49_07065 [Kribbella sp. NPDC051587]|uniref:hypothetical protein n=1 Tax=Kribbella sp. NPDC051587 TaxID=3364119 RepID=UPI0037945AD7